MCISQIVSNLLGNAIKYSPDETPIELRVTERPGEVTISVTDQGPGIPSHALEKIFERFERLDDHKRPQAGTGLGLYIARALATAIGATLHVDSQPGRGSTFSVTLRAANGGLAAVG